MAWRLARDLTTKSFPEIARYMGGRDHTTIMVGIRRLEEAMATDADLGTAYSDIRKAVLLLENASNGVERLKAMFIDHDPVGAALSYLDADRETPPSVEVVRSLAAGVLHFAEELKAAHDEVADVRIALAQQSPSLEKQRLAAAEAVAVAFRHLQVRIGGADDASAKAAFNNALITLSTLFQKDVAA